MKHASAGGESQDFDTRDFNIQVSADGTSFNSVAASAGAAFVDERTDCRVLVYLDGRRQARFTFVDGKVESWDTDHPLNFEEDRMIFAGIFQFFYLRLAIFFGCLGMFMYLFSGEMSNRAGSHSALAAPAAPASRPGGIIGLLLLSAVVLWIAGRAIRRMEISYGGEA